MARRSTLPAVAAAEAGNGWALRPLDEECSLLNGVFKEELYVREPTGYKRAGREQV